MLPMYPETALAGDWCPGAGGGFACADEDCADEPKPPASRMDSQPNAAMTRQAKAILVTRIVTFRRDSREVAHTASTEG